MPRPPKIAAAVKRATELLQQRAPGLPPDLLTEYGESTAVRLFECGDGVVRATQPNGQFYADESLMGDSIDQLVLEIASSIPHTELLGISREEFEKMRQRQRGEYADL